MRKVSEQGSIMKLPPASIMESPKDTNMQVSLKTKMIGMNTNDTNSVGMIKTKKVSSLMQQRIRAYESSIVSPKASPTAISRTKVSGVVSMTLPNNREQNDAESEITCTTQESTDISKVNCCNPQSPMSAGGSSGVANAAMAVTLSPLRNAPNLDGDSTYDSREHSAEDEVCVSSLAAVKVRVKSPEDEGEATENSERSTSTTSSSGRGVVAAAAASMAVGGDSSGHNLGKLIDWSMDFYDDEEDAYEDAMMIQQMSYEAKVMNTSANSTDNDDDTIEFLYAIQEEQEEGSSSDIECTSESASKRNSKCSKNNTGDKKYKYQPSTSFAEESELRDSEDNDGPSSTQPEGEIDVEQYTVKLKGLEVNQIEGKLNSLFDNWKGLAKDTTKARVEQALPSNPGKVIHGKESKIIEASSGYASSHEKDVIEDETSDPSEFHLKVVDDENGTTRYELTQPEKKMKDEQKDPTAAEDDYAPVVTSMSCLSNHGSTNLANSNCRIDLDKGTIHSGSSRFLLDVKSKGEKEEQKEVESEASVSKVDDPIHAGGQNTTNSSLVRKYTKTHKRGFWGILKKKVACLGCASDQDQVVCEYPGGAANNTGDQTMAPTQKIGARPPSAKEQLLI